MSEQSYEVLVEKIKAWGRRRDINNPATQIIKTVEEIGELSAAFLRREDMSDAFGDVLVTLIIQADILGYDLRLCLETAWNEIEHRVGVTENGCFVKSEE